MVQQAFIDVVSSQSKICSVVNFSAQLDLQLGPLILDGTTVSAED